MNLLKQRKEFLLSAVLFAVFACAACSSSNLGVSNGDKDDELTQIDGDAQDEEGVAETAEEAAEETVVEETENDETGDETELIAEDEIELPVEDEIADADDIPAEIEDVLTDEEIADEPKLCQSAEDCPAGQGCVFSVCGFCGKGEDCRQKEGCKDGICGKCDAAKQCAQGLACAASSGDCQSCSSAAECREGEACVERACSPCENSTQCEGKLCKNGGECSACFLTEDDGACREAYGHNYECKQSGKCAPKTCLTGVDCYLVKMVCVEHLCAPCANSYDCLAETTGGYPRGTSCVDGACVEGECRASGDCPKDRPICGENKKCRACQTHAECVDKNHSETGDYCVTETGLCVAGNCFPPWSSCETGKICGDNYMCRACAADPECVASTGFLKAICEVGFCKLGCSPPSVNAQGKVCGPDYRYRDCGEDNECALASGKESWICQSGSCLEGCVAPGANAEGLICGSDHRWHNCSGDSDCSASLANDAGVCDGGKCKIGCVAPALSGGRKVCGDDHRFRDCADDSECALASGSESTICETGTCEAGCSAPSANAEGLICGSDHRRHNCSGDSDCSAALANDAGVCDGGKCKIGCVAPALNELGQICGADHRYKNCSGDSECALAGGTESYVCEDGLCVQGCGVNADCENGGICDDHRCRACLNEEGAQADDCQKNGYTSPIMCIGGACITGECNDVLACPEEKVCDANKCYDCNYSSVKKCLDAGKVCDYENKTCVQCLNDSDCFGGSKVCENKTCRDCNSTECGDGKVCVSGSCEAGGCYIGGAIYARSATKPGDICSVCNPDLNRYAWSPNAGASCSDGAACTYDDKCDAAVAGKCGGTAYTCAVPSAMTQCATGVCHGTGPADCAIEKKSAWPGCMLEGGCFIPNQPNPANECEVCNASLNAWKRQPAGTKCGNKCQSCQAVGELFMCGMVAAGEDPNNDCTAKCQVCNGFGSCKWSDANKDVNDDCQTDNPLTCGKTGYCEGGSDACAYYEGGDVTGVNDLNECTVNDRCDGLGGKTGDPVAEGTACLSGTKVCRGGKCSDCVNSTECKNLDPNKICVSGSCVVGNCNNVSECPPAPNCQYAACINNQCVNKPLSDTTPCSDNDPCTYGDTCDGNGSCVGVTYGCSAPNQCESKVECDGFGGCVPTYKPVGTDCDDGNLCTYADKCNSGKCDGTPIACESSSSVCGLKKACNGTSECTQWYPGDATHPSYAGDCNDNNACTKQDKCNGAGTCVGTAYTCSTNQCVTANACDGNGGCNPVYAPSGTTCSDGNPCTYFYSGAACVDKNKCDACDGNGSCKGNYSVSCPIQDANCQTSRWCVGDGSCGVNNKADGTACPDDGNECTSDACSGGFCAHPKKSDYTACSEDGNVCTFDYCSNGNCYHPPKNSTNKCDDGNANTYDSVCSSYQCVGRWKKSCASSTGATSCVLDLYTGKRYYFYHCDEPTHNFEDAKSICANLSKTHCTGSSPPYTNCTALNDWRLPSYAITMPYGTLTDELGDLINQGWTTKTGCDGASVKTDPVVATWAAGSHWYWADNNSYRLCHFYPGYGCIDNGGDAQVNVVCVHE